MHARTASRWDTSDGFSSYIFTMSPDHGRSRWWSRSGTPSISAITVTGSGSARVGSMSNSPAAATPSTRRSKIAWTRGRSASTKPGVKAFETSLRTRVWSGGSMSRIPALIRSQNGACHSGGAARPISSWVAVWR